MQGTKRQHYGVSVSALIVFCLVASGPTAKAQDVRTGKFDLTFTPAELLDPDTLESVTEVIGADEKITWKMYVPETYDKGKPAGLMVYISPTTRGTLPRAWRSAMDDEYLIWISANRSGNNIDTSKRMLYAVLGPQIAARNYSLDGDRIYLSGFSGGGKVASMVAIDFANLFKGAIYIGGAAFWQPDPPVRFEQVRKNRYVFLSGQKDFNLGLTREIHRKYQEAGLSNIELMIVPGMPHSTPGARDFRAAINFLDQR